MYIKDLWTVQIKWQIKVCTVRCGRIILELVIATDINSYSFCSVFPLYIICPGKDTHVILPFPSTKTWDNVIFAAFFGLSKNLSKKKNIQKNIQTCQFFSSPQHFLSLLLATNAASSTGLNLCFIDPRQKQESKQSTLEVTIYFSSISILKLD